VERAKRSLSQNFLVDPNLQRKIVELAEPGPGLGVLEVGPGHGELTRHLVGRVRTVLAVEKDDRLARELAAAWADRSDLRVVTGDALELDLEALLVKAWGPDVQPYAILSNVPYAITSPLTFRLLDLSPPPERIVLTVQREVAERLAADPGGGDYGALTVGVQLRARVRLAFDVSREAFRPRPEVESAAVVLEPRADRPPDAELRRVRELTRAAFGRRRKQLQKILRSAPEFGLQRQEAEAVCRELGVDPRTRPAKLSPDGYRALAGRLARRG
jgi:16S rRNA (adenine1518-N6/adenine1519-N6)-dimethyltransferase